MSSLRFSVAVLLLAAVAAARIQLRDVSRRAGLDYSMGPKKTYGGPSIADLDGDGYPDLLFTHHDNTFAELYFNEGNGTFSKSREFHVWNDNHALNAFRYGPSSRAVHIALSRGGAYGRRPSNVRIFRVGRDRSISEVTPRTGMKAHSGRGRSTVFMPLSGPNAARPGRTDMLSLNARGLNRRIPHQVGFRNLNRPTTFRRTPVRGYSRVGGWYAAPVDFDNDGRMDVVSFQELSFYSVTGNFKLTEVTDDVLPRGFRPVSVVSIVELDFDNDGKWDLYVATTRTGDLGWQSKKRQYRDYLLRNVGGRYVDVTDGSGIPQDGMTRGVTAADMDNDGRIDLVVSKYRGRSVVLRNKGGGKFAAMRGVLPARLRGAPGDGVAAVDYDLDGRVDVVASEGDGAAPERGGFYRLLRNVTPPGARHYLLVRVGSSPRGGATSLHAVVRVRVGKTWMQRRVGDSGVTVSVSMIETVHFGLGASATAARVEVRWLDGGRKRLANVAGDQVVTVGSVA